MNELDVNILVKDLISQKQKLEEELTRKNAVIEELINRNEYYQKLIDNSLDITMILNEEKDIRFVHGSAEKIFGMKSSAIVGSNLLDIIDDEEKTAFEEHVQNLLNGNGFTQLTQLSIPQKDGSKKILECISQKVDAINGEINILINSRDITERAHVQEILNNSQSQLLTAQKLARVGSWEYETESNVFRWSKELQRMLGMELHSPITEVEDFLAVIEKEDQPKLQTILNEAIHHKNAFEVELSFNKESGESRILHIRGEVLAEDGEKRRIIGTGQDITSLKNAEKQLRDYSEQLRLFNIKQDMIIENERNQIAREIHDDLGQVLAVLKMDVYLLKEKVKQKLGEDITQSFREDMQSIFSRFDMLVNSVQQITHNLRPEVISDLGLVEAIKWQCSDFEAQTGIMCTFDDKTGDLADMLIEYKNAFFRIVQQSLKNVAEHADASKAEVKLKYDENHLTLKVKDNGKGIRDDRIRHPNSMGLLSMKERSHYLGGDFSIHGIPEKGTEVQLKIPVNEILFKY